MLEKQKIHKFGSDMYLLGIDKDGTEYWLEAPSWDCGWYWGFGYIETLNKSKTDIESHQHATDFYTKWKSNVLKQTTFTDEESWALCELFDNFYTLRELADAQHHNGKLGNYTAQRHGLDFNTLFKKGLVINRDCLPFVMAKIISILTPDENETADSLELKYKDMLLPKITQISRNIKSVQKIIGQIERKKKMTIKSELESIRKEIEQEKDLYMSEVVFLQEHKEEVKKYFPDDPVMWQWAGIPEEEWS